MSKFMMWKVFSAVMALMLVLQLSGLAMLPVPAAATDPVVTFPDVNLEAAIRVAISKPTGDIYASELAALYALNANGRSIGILDGLEYCTNLRWLLLRNNQVSDLSALAGLTYLEGLDLTNNQVSGLSALAVLTRMTVLDLSDNQISDVAPLAAMDNLTNLGLPNNLVSNLAPLAGKANLVFLNLNNNRVSDLSPLTGLTGLNTLGMNDNQISDLAPLAGLTALTGLWIGGNRISNLTPLAGLTNLTLLGMNNNRISDITPLAGMTKITGLDLNNNQISDLTPLTGMTSISGIGLGNNRISDLSPLAGMIGLTGAILHNNYISDLSALAGLTGLTGLGLRENQICNIAPLAGLTKLTVLDLRDNQISDITPLAGLTSMSRMGLCHNRISDLSPLVGLTSLTLLGLRYNPVSDISALAANPGFNTGDYLFLTGDPLSNTSINVHIPALQAKGVSVIRADISTFAATNITQNAATLNGRLDFLFPSENVPVSFQWRTASGRYDNATTAQVMTADGNFSQNLIGLQAGTTYFYRAQAVYYAQQAAENRTSMHGPELSFTTSGIPGQVTTTTGSGTLTLNSDLGNITSLSAISIETLPNRPPLLLFPHGLMYFEVNNITPGSTVTFTITFPVALPANIQYWKYQPARGFFQIPITSHNGNVITIQITDGGLGDADGLANGIIIDPGGVAVNNPSIVTRPPSSSGSAAALTPQAPVALSNIYVQSASLSASKVTPGTPVAVTANVANRGTVNGSTRIKLYVNGVEDSGQGVTVESGGNRPVYFTVNRSQPGTYDVYIGGTQAGSFMVEDAIDSNVILFVSLAMILFALVLGAIMIARRNLYY